MLKKIFFILRMLFFNIFCLLVPINKKKIVFCSCYGNSFSCNPKYILKEILTQKLNYELVYLLNSPFEEIENVKIVNYKNIFKRMFHLASAKIWIDSYQKIDDFKKGLIKKKGQIYINCWHGSLGIKKYGYDRGLEKGNKSYLYFFKKDVQNIDYMISNCAWEEEKYKSALGFQGKILRLGHARNDIFYKNEAVKLNLAIKKNNKLALYMPTFRDDLSVEHYKINHEKITKVLENKFGGKWVVISKFHNKDKNAPNDLKQMDSHELLMLADILISDYSSVMFDFMCLKRPCFVYANDIEKYNNDRGLYFSLDETPFLIAKNEQELESNILNFDIENYKLKAEEFLTQRNVLDDGNSSKRIVEFIKNLPNNSMNF